MDDTHGPLHVPVPTVTPAPECLPSGSQPKLVDYTEARYPAQIPQRRGSSIRQPNHHPEDIGRRHTRSYRSIPELRPADNRKPEERNPVKSSSLPRLMIINLNGEDPARLVQRYLPVARARLGFDVDTVWCSREDLDTLRKSLDGIEVLASRYCPPGSYQLGKRVKGGENRCRPR